MSNILPGSAMETSSQYHPSFELDVVQVVFSVDGQKFKTDASRLAEHSEFLRIMLFESGDLIGSTGEGTDGNPIIVQGCTQSAFANFLFWLNHKTWESPTVDPIEGNIDILHLCHMWEIRDGEDYAIDALDTQKLNPARKIHLARKYDIQRWFASAVRALVHTPFERYTPKDLEFLGFTTFVAIACAKEDIQCGRQLLSSSLPYPKDLDIMPYCSDPDTCKKVWFTVWICEIGKLVHNANHYMPSSEITSTLRTLPYQGMHGCCKDYILDWVDNNCPGFGREDAVLRHVTREVQHIPF